eukprot:scaffold14323_cov101-Isochrysis_galbana.AAC.2
MSFVDENDVSLRLTVRPDSLVSPSPSRCVGRAALSVGFAPWSGIFSGQWALCFNGNSSDLESLNCPKPSRQFTHDVCVLHCSTAPALAEAAPDGGSTGAESPGGGGSAPRLREWTWTSGHSQESWYEQEDPFSRPCSTGLKPAATSAEGL